MGLFKLKSLNKDHLKVNKKPCMQTSVQLLHLRQEVSSAVHLNKLFTGHKYRFSNFNHLFLLHVHI